MNARHVPEKGAAGTLPVEMIPNEFGFAFRQAMRLAIAPGEGGDSDHPSDPGGRTRWGITERTFHAWLRSKRRPPRSIWTMSAQEASEIYWERYWESGLCPRLPWPASMAHMDAMVQHGPGGRGRGGAIGAIHLLQRAAGVDDDGIPGEITLEAVAELGVSIAPGLLWERAMHYWGIGMGRPDLWKAFGRGWRNRVRHLRETVLAEMPPTIVVEPPSLREPHLSLSRASSGRAVPLPRDTRTALRSRVA